VVEALMALLTGRRPLMVRHWRGLIVAALAAGLVFSPLAVFFISHPGAFTERAGSVSIFNPAWNQGDLWGALARTALTTLGTFADLTGDPNPLGNLPGQPMLGLPLALFFWVGVAMCLWRVICYLRSGLLFRLRHGLSPGPGTPQQPPLPYLFLLCWWPVMLLPGILAPEGAPHHLRLIGTAPATYVLVAIGCGALIRLVQQALSRWFVPGSSVTLSEAKGLFAYRPSFFASLRMTARGDMEGLKAIFSLALPLILFLPIGAVTAQLYFGRWTQLPELYMAYDVYAVQLAQEIAADDAPGTAYVIPMDLRAGDEARHYTLDFMYRGRTPYSYLPVDDRTAAEQLTRAATGMQTLRVVRWTQDKHIAADEREVVTYLLATTARLEGEKAHQVYRIETWTLPSAHTRFQLPVPDRPVGATFEGVLQLETAHLSAGGGWVGVALRWMPLAPINVDYKASLRLVAADGTLAAQKDRLLRHNWHQGTHLWPAEPVNEYYLLTPAPPGKYDVRVVVYNPDTLSPLIVNGQADLSLGAVQVPGTR
jgi:hypothetical protein